MGAKIIKKNCKNIWWLEKKAILLSFGEVAEWSIAAVLKTVVLRGTGGSNPSLSARSQCRTDDLRHPFWFCVYFVREQALNNRHKTTAPVGVFCIVCYGQALLTYWGLSR